MLSRREAIMAGLVGAMGVWFPMGDYPHQEAPYIKTSSWGSNMISWGSNMIMGYYQDYQHIRYTLTTTVNIKHDNIEIKCYVRHYKDESSAKSNPLSPIYTVCYMWKAKSTSQSWADGIHRLDGDTLLLFSEVNYSKNYSLRIDNVDIKLESVEYSGA